MNDKLKKQLFWEKFRPKTLNDTILPDRILNMVKDGIHTNYIFHGDFGIGKTTLAKILIKDNPNLVLSSKLGVEELRSQVNKFCREYAIGDNPNDMKIVFFEEFDRASKQLQEELKTFVEDFSDNVRFIATTNHVKKLTTDITNSGRFKLVDFSLTNEEEKDIKTKYKKRILEVLAKEKIEIPKDILKSIFINAFPNFRKIWNEIQNYHLSGTYKTGVSAVSTDYEDLFKVIFSKNKPNETWDYLYANWLDRLEEGFNVLGRPFFDWIYKNKPEFHNKLADIVITVSEYSDIRFSNSNDPFITLCALVFKIKDITK